MSESPGLHVKRLNINLPENVYNDLQRLAAASGRSMTEVIRTGFGLAKIAIEEAQKGQKLSVTTPEGRIVKEIILPH